MTATPSPVEKLTVVSTGGARLHTEIHGGASPGRPTAVLVHGWTCSTAFWRPVLARLADTHRVVVYDQRGHGRTPHTPGSCGTPELADDLCAVLAATVPSGERAVLAGHSMGAMTILAAATRPELRERAAAALLCSTGAHRLGQESTVIPLRPGRRRDRLNHLFLTTAVPYGPVWPGSERLVAHVTLGPGATRAQRSQVARIVQACPRRVRAEWGRVLDRLDLSASVPELRLPTVVVQGTADRLTPAVHAHRIAARLPDCREFVELPGVGHMTPVEATGTIVDVLHRLTSEHLTPPTDPAKERNTA